MTYFTPDRQLFPKWGAPRNFVRKDRGTAPRHLATGHRIWKMTMKTLIIAAALVAASITPAVARSESDEWADKAFSKDEQASMERAVKTIELSAECFHYRLLMDTSMQEKNKEGPQIAKAVIALAFDVYGKLYDAMKKDPKGLDVQGGSRDFFIGMMYGGAQAKGEAEALNRTAADPLSSVGGKKMFDASARHLYRERNCDLLPRAK